MFSSIHDGGRVKSGEREKSYFRVKDGVLIPYIRKQLKSLVCLDEVLIGPKQKSDIASKGLKYFLRNLKLDVKINQSQMPLRY